VFLTFYTGNQCEKCEIIFNCFLQTSLVEHFKFCSEKMGEKCPLLFTLVFTEKASEKLETFQ
jgi:hypothetical protein